MCVNFPPRLLSALTPRSPALDLVHHAHSQQFLTLHDRAAVVITDSGGIQEETTYLGVPCLTMRKNTERPVTETLGTNTLVGHDMALLKAEVEKVLNGKGKKGRVPALWDGHAARRIADIIVHFLHTSAQGRCV